MLQGTCVEVHDLFMDFGVMAMRNKHELCLHFIQTARRRIGQTTVVPEQGRLGQNIGQRKRRPTETTLRWDFAKPGSTAKARRAKE